jgi:hypothetical protein
MMKAAAAPIIRARDNLKNEVTGTSKVLVPNRICNCIPDVFNMTGTKSYSVTIKVPCQKQGPQLTDQGHDNGLPSHG